MFFCPYSWLTRRDAEEFAFQCSDDVYDMKILHDVIICGLRNGTVEVWNKETLKKELSLEDQNGTVLVSKQNLSHFAFLVLQPALPEHSSSLIFQGRH